MKIQIAGYGFVGMAHALALQASGIEVHIYDPYKGEPDWCKDCDAIIIAVSTPQHSDGSCDMSNVYSCVEAANLYNPDTPILIKSTISLDGWRLINRSYPGINITFSPEFLRAEHALEDFKKQTATMIGGGHISFWMNVLSTSLGTYVDVTDPEVLILTKYFRNSYLATKVAFFNQMYDICEAAGVDAKKVLTNTAKDDRIGTSHTQITEERGFGGHCFPKDTSAICQAAKEYGKPMTVLEAAREYNDYIRRNKE